MAFMDDGGESESISLAFRVDVAIMAGVSRAHYISFVLRTIILAD